MEKGEDSEEEQEENEEEEKHKDEDGANEGEHEEDFGGRRRRRRRRRRTVRSNWRRKLSKDWGPGDLVGLTFGLLAPCGVMVGLLGASGRKF